MRCQLQVFCMLTGAATTVGAASLQLLTRFDQTPPAATVQAMRTELDRLYRDARISIAWHELWNFSSVGAAPPIVYVDFIGVCRSRSLPARQTVTSGALAGVSRVDGKMLPSVTVDCEQIAAYIWPFMTGAQRSSGDAAFGEVLARILAHELYHYLTGTVKHTASALFRGAISPRALLDRKLKLEESEIAVLKEVLSPMGLSPGSL